MPVKVHILSRNNRLTTSDDVDDDDDSNVWLAVW